MTAQDQASWSIRKSIRTARRYRTRLPRGPAAGDRPGHRPGHWRVRGDGPGYDRRCHKWCRHHCPVPVGPGRGAWHGCRAGRRPARHL